MNTFHAVSCDSTFSFRKTNSNEVSKIIHDLNIKKLAKIMIFLRLWLSNKIKTLVHSYLKTTFPLLTRINFPNYKQVSILSNFSKIPGKLMYKQFYLHFESTLSSSQCGFRKRYIAQHSLYCLLILKSKEIVDNGLDFGALLTHLSKLYWYGASHKSLELIFPYYENRTLTYQHKQLFQ